MSVYLYAVARATNRVGGDVDVVRHRDLAAVTSPFEGDAVKARRRDLMRHSEVIQRAFEQGTVLPLRFGIVVDEVVADLLEPRYDELVRLLDAVEGLAEVTVRAFYREQDVLRALVTEDPRLDRMRRTAPPVELGEAVARRLAARRDADANAIVRALADVARDTAVDEPQSELEVFRGAFLVPREKLDAADAAVERLARAHAATTAFKYTGPLAPHHFVHLAGAA